MKGGAVERAALEEEARLEAVRRYEILDTPPDSAFERVTALAARLFEVPIAIIGIVDRDRIWFKSHYGIELVQIGRDPGLCASAIMQTAAPVISDATLDPHAFATPLVTGEFGFRFYAAVPLRTSDGFNLGTLCIIDRQPREIGEEGIATLHDLAAIVVDELELRRAARSEEQRLERVRADFTATVSHELKTPLAAVYGAAITLARTDSAVDEETRERLLAVIIEEGERLRDMFEDVLATSQLESGSFRIFSGELHPAELARSAAEAARVRLPASLTIDVHVHRWLPTVHGDPTRVRQVLENLLDNAIKYSPAGGRIELRVEAHDDTIRFHVSDHGAGIPESERERIFRRYHRLDSGLRDGVTGTGLGLYVCQQLAIRMGGQIELNSREGHGSTFTLALPLVQPGEHSLPDRALRG